MDRLTSNPRAQEHPTEVSSSELGRSANLLMFEALSVSDSPVLTPQTTEEESDDDYNYWPPIPGRQTIRYSGPQSTAKKPATNSDDECEASNEKIIENGNAWMREEVMVAFKKYIETRPDHMGFEYHLDELCHQCFNVEDYNKVFHHYNFTVRMKKPDSIDWIVTLYFAEVKEIFGRKYYFCCPLEPNENGHCSACKNQGVEDLKHPATGGFDAGSPDAPEFNFWYTTDEDE